MEGGIEVVEYKALVGQLIECRGQLRVNSVARETFQCQENHVIALEHPGIFILSGGSHAVEIVG